MLLAMFLLSTVITVVIQKSVSGETMSMSYGFYYIWAVIVSVSVPKMPKTTLSRILFCMWVCYSFAISTVFQAFFTSFLIEPNVDQQISSMRQLISSGLSLVGKEELILPVAVEISKSDVETPNYLSRELDDGIEYFFESNGFALVANDLNMKVKFQMYYRKGLKLCSFIHFTRSVYVLNFLFNSPYYERYSSKLKQYFEGGLIEKLINIYSDSNYVSLNHFSHFEDKIKFSIDINDRYFSLNLQHLRIAFLLLISGYALSFMLLLAEIV
ncbi:hypothetical protein L9F63_020574 [Diploptera punctata]|uniref:Ionotropic glutamate receptor C-terminal domain-containing protein n=1 Tax=Diploptera punctata TaxID=6984 RepID=A0AAD7ZR13_DIPPU|nr:hypothetical protein L9F63_020574 [Diploptera punctata]